MEVRSRPRVDSDGGFHGYVGIAIDHTETRAAEAALRESERRFREAADSSPSPMWMTDADGKMEFVNCRLEEYAGMSADALKGDAWLTLVHPDDAQLVAQEREAAWRDSHRPYTFEARFKRADGTWRWLEVSSRPRLDPAGRFHGYVGIAVDRTESRAAIETLAESERRYRSIFSAAGAAIWEEDFTTVKAELDALKAGGISDFANYFEEHPEFVDRMAGLVRLLEVNDAALAIYNAADKASLLQSLSRIFVPETRPAFAKQLLALVAGEASVTAEAVCRTLDGRRLDLLFSISFGPDLSRVPVVIMDITARKIEERRALFLDALAEKTRFAASADALLEAAAELIGEKSGAARAAFAEFDDAKKAWIVRREWRADESAVSLVGEFPVSLFPRPILDDLKRGVSVAVEDTASDPRTAPFHETTYKPIDVRAFVRVPLLREGRWRFGLAVQSAAPRRWTTEEIALLELAAERVWNSIEKLRLDEALRASEERFRTIIDQNTVAIAEMDLDGRFLLVNDRYCGMTGYSRDELLKMTIEEVTHEADAARQSKLLERLAAKGEAYVLEKRCRRKDGAVLFVQTAVSPLFGPDGRPQRAVAAKIDITERKAAEARLRESEERFRTLADNIGTLCWIADASGHVFWRNRRWFEYTGADPERMDEWDYRSVHDPNVLPEVEARWQDSLRTGRPFEMTFPLKGADGKFRPFLTRIEPVRDDKGRVWRWFGTNTDISEQQRYEQHLRFMLDELNHRVKNTLAIVQGVAQQSFAEASVTAESRSAFEGRLQALAAAHNILTRRNWEPTDLKAVVEESVKGFGEERVRIEGPAVPLAPKAAVTVAMAIHELAANAMKYGALSAAEGRVDVLWKISGDEAPRLNIRWRELGGPKVEPPRRRGFGSLMVEHALASELDAEVALTFDPDGVVCEIDAPLPKSHGGRW
jgi:PAS domain S-box-containing protein